MQLYLVDVGGPHWCGLYVRVGVLVSLVLTLLLFYSKILVNFVFEKNYFDQNYLRSGREMIRIRILVLQIVWDPVSQFPYP
jgi:hypothetical protein